MTYEYAEPHRRGLFASLPQIGLSIGLCLASGVVALFSYLLSDAQFLAWGWRVAFLLSVILVGIGIYIRLRIFETPEFAALKAQQGEARLPFLDMIKEYPANILAGMGARYIDGVFFNIFAVFMIGYLVNTLHIARTDALLGVMLAALVMCVFIPIFGHLSDRHGRGKIYALGALITGFSAFPALWLILNSSGNVGLIWLAIIVPFGIFYAACYGPEAALFCDLFGTRVRYTGVSFVYQFSGIFASGLTPIIATGLLPLNGGQPWLICAYILFSALVSAYSAWWIEQRAKAGGPISMAMAENRA
jgi:MFS transporter, MHS family, shikimate and dehydroshikimate transport protein